MSGSSVTLAAVGPRAQAAFTALQWQELEHQALIFKYLKAGLLVPPELLTSIRKSFNSVSARFSHQPGLGYFSYYGKKIDPEPGRCRRTDGKKWRCSKDAYLDSKYCERHKNRGRYRSRKPVESKITSQSLSAVASDVVTGSSSGNGGFQNWPLHSSVTCEGLCFGSTVSRLQMEAATCGTRNKEYRCLQGLKRETDEQNFLPETSGSLKGLGINSTIDSTWRIMKSQIPSNPLPDSRNGAILQSNYPQLQIPEDFEPQQQRYLFGWEFGSPASVKPEHQSFQTLSNQWPESRDVGSYLNDPRANNNSSSTTQLSMSLPMAPDFFARSAHSSNGKFTSIYVKLLPPLPRE